MVVDTLPKGRKKRRRGGKGWGYSYSCMNNAKIIVTREGSRGQTVRSVTPRREPNFVKLDFWPEQRGQGVQ